MSSGLFPDPFILLRYNPQESSHSIPPPSTAVGFCTVFVSRKLSADVRIRYGPIDPIQIRSFFLFLMSEYVASIC